MELILNETRLAELETYIEEWDRWFPDCASLETEKKRLDRIPLTHEEVSMYFWMGHQRAKFARWMSRWLRKVRKDNEQETKIS